MSSVVTEFPDQTYTTSNKPSVETLKSDIAALETGHNDLETTAMKLAGTQTVTGQKTFGSGLLVTTAPVIRAWDAWNAVADTWTYASPTTITVPTGAASLYKKGDKFKLTANSVVLYGYIITVADTLLTVAGDALTNHTFTATAVSHDTSPIGFPDYFSFTGAASGMTSISETHKFALNGTICTVQSVVTGTGSTTSRAMELPIAAKEEVRTNVYAVNNGTTTTGRADTVAGSKTLNVWRLIDGSNWTSSGSSAFTISMSYIIN